MLRLTFIRPDELNTVFVYSYANVTYCLSSHIRGCSNKGHTMHFVKGLILLPSSSILLSDLALNNLYEAILSK